MELIPCGTKVTSVIGSIEGMIVKIEINFNCISYNISYFVNPDFKNVWMNESEFTITINRQSIGFKNQT